jgi:hypothetical protein
MRTLRSFVLSTAMVVAALGAARADEKKVLVPGDPPLTQDMLDDYGKYAEWRWGSALKRLGGPERLAELIVNDWKNGNKARQETFLAELKWWREDFPRLASAERGRPDAKNQAPAPDVERVRPSVRDTEAIHLLKLQQWYDARQLEIRAISNIRAKGHETNMQIINNIRPTGRYEYNPATGRYDRYVP